MDHGAGVVESHDVLRHATTAGRVDHVRGGHRPDQRVQPGRISAYPPARLIGHDPFGLPHRLTNVLVDRLAEGGGPQHGVNAAAATERDTEKALQAASDLAV